jgi:hypothetical protein
MKIVRNASDIFPSASKDDVGIQFSSQVLVGSQEPIVTLAQNAISISKDLVMDVGKTVSLGSPSAAFESIHVRNVRGDVVFNGSVTFSRPFQTQTSLVAVKSGDWGAPFTPVQSTNESGNAAAVTRWIMTNGSNVGLRFQQNGRACTQLGGSNAAFVQNMAGDLFIGTTSNARAMGFYSAGPLANAVCIGVTAENMPGLVSIEKSNLSTYKLVVNGTAWSTGWRTISDRNSKRNIESISGAMGKVRDISGYTYNLKSDERRYAGVMAQEVERVLPEAVDQVIDGSLALDYNGVLALVVEAVKELDARMRQDSRAESLL